MSLLAIFVSKNDIKAHAGKKICLHEISSNCVPELLKLVWC
jgi:hypothetical protein